MIAYLKTLGWFCLWVGFWVTAAAIDSTRTAKPRSFSSDIETYMARPNDTTTGSPVFYRADGTIISGAIDRMVMKPITQDSVVFDDDSLAVIQLVLHSSLTRRKTAPTSIDKLTVIGPFSIPSYDAATGKVTVKALFSAGTTPITVPLRVQ